MSVRVSGRESRVKGGTTHYKGWVYASTCGHALGVNQTPHRGLCRVCQKWAVKYGTWDEHRGFTPDVDPRPVDEYRLLARRGRLDVLRREDR